MKITSTSPALELIDSANRFVKSASSAIYKGIGWSPIVVLGHLSDVDEQVWQARIDLMVQAHRAKEPRPSFSSWEPDPLATQQMYENYSLEEAVSRFLSMRTGMVGALNVLDVQDWQASASHATFGVLTLTGIIEKILLHDLEHLASLG